MMDLKPCPFCGGARLRLDQDEHSDHRIIDTVVFVRCDDCGARGSEVAMRGAVNPERTAKILWDIREVKK